MMDKGKVLVSKELYHFAKYLEVREYQILKDIFDSKNSIYHEYNSVYGAHKTPYDLLLEALDKVIQYEKTIKNYGE